MARSKNADEPEIIPQESLVKEMDDLDYSSGTAPESTTTPEQPMSASDADPLVVEEGAPPPVEAEAGGEMEASPKEGEPTPIAGTEAEVKAETVGETVVPVKTAEEKLKELQDNQVAHYQRLYEDLRKELDDLKSKAAPVEVKAEAAAPKPPSPEEIRKHYEPEMERVVDQGYMSREFVEDYPNDVAQMLYHRDILYNAVKKVEELTQWVSSTAGQQRNNAAESQLNTILDKVSSKGVHFQPLADPEVRKAFRGYLDQVNPMCNADNVEDVISQQYLAFNHQAVLAALSGGSTSPPQPAPNAPAPAPARNLAMGEHGGTRSGGGTGSSKKDPFLAEMDALDF